MEATYTRARELCRQVGETPQLFPVLLGLWHVLFYARGVTDARELGEQLLTPGPERYKIRRSSCPGSHDAREQVLFYLGEFVSAREHFEQGVALYDPQQHRSDAFLYAE